MLPQSSEQLIFSHVVSRMHFISVVFSHKTQNFSLIMKKKNQRPIEKKLKIYVWCCLKLLSSSKMKKNVRNYYSHG